MDPDAPALDLYAPLTHRLPLGDPLNPRRTVDHRLTAPGWIPREHRRRINAYTARLAIERNVTRWFAQPTTFDAAELREYGDPGNLLDRFVAGALGDGWQITVDGADDDLPPTPDLPDQPEDPGPEASPRQRRIYEVVVARWEYEADRAVEEWAAAVTAQPALRRRQKELRAWAERAQFRIMRRLWERKALGIGDGIAVLWPQRDGWPKIEILDAEGYFPVETEHDDSEFPRKLHFAWEYTVHLPGGETQQWLRRITFELVDIASTRSAVLRDGTLVWVDANRQPADTPPLAENEGIDDHGRIWRLYPWVLAEDPDWTPGKPPAVMLPGGVRAEDVRSFTTCVLSDGSWRADDLGDDLGALDESRAVWRVVDGRPVHRVDLLCDFIPVVHSPGLVVSDPKWGASVFDSGSQALEDLAYGDTKVARAAEFLADPTVFIKGVEMAKVAGVVPGRAYGSTANNAGFDVIDFTENHDQAVKHVDRLEDRTLSVLSMPREMVGKVDSGDVASGIALALSFGPFGQTVISRRDVSNSKDQLLLKMVQRLAQVAGVLPPGQTPTARITYGTYLPTNKSEAMSLVTDGLTSHGMSTQTAVAILVGAGFPVDDARAEVERIRSEHTAAAVDVADALAGAPNALEVVADRLGVEITGTPADLPPIPLPGIEGAGQ